MSAASRAKPAQPSSPPPAPPAGPRSIVNPAFDILAAGGLSILIFIPLLATGRSDLQILSPGVQAWIGTLINLPHFMASYRMVYRDRATIRKHRWAAIGVPVILLVYMVFAVWQSATDDRWVSLLLTVQGGYLAWHYTGQAWGMVATHTFLAGAPMNRLERILVRDGLRVLTLWQVTWFIHWFYTNGQLPLLYQAMSYAAVVPLAAGLIGFFLYRTRTGGHLPLPAFLAWAAVFVWYLVLARDINALFWVQNAHALQYLAFPMRVELNRATVAAEGKASRLVTRMALWAAALLAASVVWSQVLPGTAMDLVGQALGERPGRMAGMMVMTFLNIHHFFTDGVLWKLRNPEVRADLFGHVRPAAAPRGG